MLARQRADGSWPYRGGLSHIRSAEDYDQLATYENLLVLVAKYRLTRDHPALQAAARYLLEHQAPEGDLRGIYGTQYSPNYSAAILALLVEGGLGAEPRVERGLDWLLAMRQEDGGWAIPLRTVGGPLARSFRRAMALPAPLSPDRTRPSSHLITGIVLRPLAAHPRYRGRPETLAAATLLARRFFRPDTYPDRAAAGYWTKLAFPFRWTDLASALDALTLIGQPGADDPGVARALRWLRDYQGSDGLLPAGYEKSADPLAAHWVTFAVARLLGRLG